MSTDCVWQQSSFITLDYFVSIKQQELYHSEIFKCDPFVISFFWIMSFTRSDDTYTPTPGRKWTTNAVHFWMSLLQDEENRKSLCTMMTKEQLYELFCNWLRAFVTRHDDHNLSRLERVWKCGNGCNECGNDVIKSTTCYSRFHTRQPMTPQVVSFLLRNLPDGGFTDPSEDRIRYRQSGTATADEYVGPVVDSSLQSPDSWTEYNEHIASCVTYMETLPAIAWYNAMKKWVDHRIANVYNPWINSKRYGDGILFQIIKDFTFAKFIEVADKDSAIFKLKSAKRESLGFIHVIGHMVEVNKSLLHDVMWYRTPPSDAELRKQRVSRERQEEQEEHLMTFF